ncbi:MAG: TonB-dependent receptor [Tannerellaceae bacterium]|nr:TonB-dependent receptor [Tannerellaceae bacterium]
MRNCVAYMFTFLWLLCTTQVFAQTTVSGTVTDENGEALIGVNVQVKGTTIGNITDVDGKYSLQTPSAQSVLVFSYIGYLPQEITVGNQSVIDVLLREDTQRLEEVVVVGYGTQRKVTVTGSVASLRGEELKASPTTNLTNGMVGRMPGVIGFQRSDEPGGGGTTIRIRGTNSLGSKDPLIVIDGVPGRSGGIDRLNPNEIESISVLKDAAAAIYGSRAANGVILVTTKRGKEGKPTLTYSGNAGYSTPTRLPEMANAYEYATMMNDIDRYSGRSHRYTEEDLRLFQDGSDPWGHPNTNYVDLAIKDISPTYRHDLGISGGNDRVKYYVNLAANGEDGIYKQSANRYDQFSVRANLDMKINNYITLSYGTIGRMEVRNYPTYSADETFTAIVRSKPTMIGFWPTGEPGPDLEYGHNPVVMGTDATGYDTQKDYYIQNTLKAVITVPGVTGLSLTASGSYDKYFKMRKRFRTPFLLYNWIGDAAHTLTPGWKGPATPELLQEHTDQTAWMMNAVANYDFSIGNNNFGVSVGIEGEDKQQDWLTAERKYFISDALAEMDNGGLAELTNSGNSWEESRLNYFGRVSYNYQERYLVEFVWRYDGSYRFPKDKRYGFFPGVSAAWRVSEEGFWKENVTFIDYFKLRGSVSQTGNDALLDADGNYDRSIQYLNTYGFGTDYLLGSTFNKTLKPTRTPNPNITWEVGTTYDIGLDLKFFNNRLNWESDLFYHKRTNMLISRNASLPQTSGITLPRENLGEMSNRGFETLLSWNDKAGKINYGAALNLTYAKNKIDFWDETPNIPDYQRSTGRPVGTELFYLADGVFNTQEELDNYPHWTNARLGDIKFVDYDNDGDIDGDDRIRIDKVKEPTLILGVTLNASWNNFDIMALFQGATGGHTYIWRERAGEAGNFYKWTYDHRWTEENPMIEHPRTYNRENEYWASEGDRKNTYYLWNTDYLRLKNIEIGYTFNLPAIRNTGIQNLRLYVNATNVFTLDKVKVQDPEQNNTSKDYPQRKMTNVGVSITF